MTIEELGAVQVGDILRSPINNKLKVLYVRTAKDTHTKKEVTVRAIFMGGTVVNRKNCEHWEVVDK